MAAFGTIIALINLGFSIFKMVRDRRLSVDDDFWFRKVVTPTAIEPALEMFVELLHEMPLLGSPAETQRDFAVKVSTDMQKLRNTMQALALFDQDLPGKVTRVLMKCEDILMDYCTELAKAEADVKAGVTSSAPSVEDTRASVWNKLSLAMQHIRDRQIKA